MIELIAERPNSEPVLRARAITLLPSVCDDEARLDRLLLAAVRSAREDGRPDPVHESALETIVSARRTGLVPHLLSLLVRGRAVTDAIVRLGDARIALAALESARRGEAVAISLERLRIAGELGGKDVVEPLRMFLTAGSPRELSSPARAAIEKVKSRLVAVDGGLSLSDAGDAQGRLSTVTAAGALSDPEKKPRR